MQYSLYILKHAHCALHSVQYGARTVLNTDSVFRRWCSVGHCVKHSGEHSALVLNTVVSTVLNTVLNTSVEHSAEHSALVLNTWKVAQEENWGCVSCYCRQLEATNWVVLLGMVLVVLVLVLLGLVLHSVTAL